MRRYLIVIFILITVSACFGLSTLLQRPTVTIIPPTRTTTTTPIPASPIPTVTNTPTSTAVAPTVTATITSTQVIPAGPFTVLFHPDGELYIGDQVSLEVIAPPGLELKDSSIKVQVDPPNGQVLGMVKFGQWGIQAREEATMLWAWDTHNLTPGEHSLAFSSLLGGYRWDETVTLLPASELPADQADAHWAETKTKCCAVFYITNTAAERDLPTLTALIDEQAQLSMEEMDANFTQPITITLLPRLLGHGGFTSTDISVSYLDRNYAAEAWAMVIHHEMIHAIDGHLGGDFRPTIFVEGLAVYETGGHYAPEQLLPSAAALLPENLNLYIPLKTLADDFYASQHEIGYLEGASLIHYMVNTYGWQAFNTFYRDIHQHQGENQSDAIDAALKVHFSISFDQLEQNYVAALKAQTNTSEWVDHVRLTVSYFDTLRRYQQLLDPSAYFRTAWLLDNESMRQRGIVADYLRHPHTPVNLALETLFITASREMSAKDYAKASQVLEVINSVLDGIEHGTPDPFSVSPMAADYLTIAATLQKQGYEAQSIRVNQGIATVEVTTSTGPDLQEINLQRSGGEWTIIP